MRRLVIAAIVVLVILVIVRRRRHRRWFIVSRFTPVPELPCGPRMPPEYAVDTTGRGAAGTVVWGPYLPGINRAAPSRLAALTRRSAPSGPRTSMPARMSSSDSDLESEGMHNSISAREKPATFT